MLHKILNIVAITLFSVTFIILALFIWGGSIPNAQYYTPAYTETLLNWAFILCGIAAISALIFPIIHLFTRPKEAMKSFIGIAVLAVIVLVAYALADPTPMKIIGYSGTDNVPSMLLFSDTILYTMYILFGGAILAIIGTELLRKVR